MIITLVLKMMYQKNIIKIKRKEKLEVKMEIKILILQILEYQINLLLKNCNDRNIKNI